MAITPSIISVETSPSGGREGSVAGYYTGVGPDVGQNTDSYQHNISAISFVKADCLAGVTDVVYNGYAGSSTIPSANNTYLLQGSQVTATTDAGTTVSVSSSTSTEETDTFGLTGSISGYPIFNLQVSKDSTDVKLKLTFLSEHATGTTDYDSVMVGVPFAIKTMSGTSNDVFRYFTIQKQKAALAGDDAATTNEFIIDVVPPTIVIPVPIPSGTEFHTSLQSYASGITDFAKLSGRYGPTNLTFNNSHSGVPGSDDLWAFNTHGKLDFVSASMVTGQGTALPIVNSNKNTFIYTGDPDVHFFQTGMNLDGNDAKFEWTPSGSDGNAAKPFPGMAGDDAPIRHIDFRFPCVAQISGSLLVATGSCRVTYQYADTVSLVDITASPSVVSVVTSVTGGTPNGVAATTVAGVGAINGQTTDIYRHDISSTAFLKADAFEGVSTVVYDGFGSGSFISPTAGKFYIQGHQITASTDTGLVVSASAASHPANGTNDFGITGSIGTTPIFNLQVEDDGNDAKMSVTFLAEHASSADYDSIKIDIPFATTNSDGLTLHNKIRSFNIQKVKNPADPVDGTDATAVLTQNLTVKGIGGPARTQGLYIPSNGAEIPPLVGWLTGSTEINVQAPINTDNDSDGTVDSADGDFNLNDEILLFDADGAGGGDAPSIRTMGRSCFARVPLGQTWTITRIMGVYNGTAKSGTTKVGLFLCASIHADPSTAVDGRAIEVAEIFLDGQSSRNYDYEIGIVGADSGVISIAASEGKYLFMLYQLQDNVAVHQFECDLTFTYTVT